MITIDVRSVKDLNEMRSLIKDVVIDVINSVEILVMSSDNVKIDGLEDGKVIGYIGVDRPNTFVELGERVRFIGDISDGEKTLYEVDPDLFGYRITEYEVNELFVYMIEEYDCIMYNISNQRLRISDLG